MSIELIIALITGIGGLAVALYNAVNGARKSTVEELRGIIAEVKGMYETEKQKRQELETKVTRLENELEDRDEVILDLQRWAEQLVGQLRIHAPQIVPVEFKRTKKLLEIDHG